MNMTLSLAHQISNLYEPAMLESKELCNRTFDVPTSVTIGSDFASNYCSQPSSYIMLCRIKP